MGVTLDTTQTQLKIHMQRLHKQLLLGGRNLATASIDFRFILFQLSNKI